MDPMKMNVVRIKLSINLMHYYYLFLLAAVSTNINECNSTDNGGYGGCDHYCHDTVHYRYCSCRDGYTLNSTDMSTCYGKREREGERERKGETGEEEREREGEREMR